MKILFMVVSLIFLSEIQIAHADWSLRADQAPVSKPWEDPAKISYSRKNGEESRAIIDLQIEYSRPKAYGHEKQAIQIGPVFSTYIHRDTINDTPRNDRGIGFGFGALVAPNSDPQKGVRSYGLKANVSFGKSLESVEEQTQDVAHEDLEKERETFIASGYYQPRLEGIPGTRRLVMFFEGSTGIYSDKNHGGNDVANGRLSGGLVSAAANFAPYGLDPGDVKIGTLGVVPTIKFSAQVQHDVERSGDRRKDVYRLFVARLSLSFSKLGGAGSIVPSINLERSIGEDLLTGRPDQSKTEVSLGLTF